MPGSLASSVKGPYVHLRVEGDVTGQDYVDYFEAYYADLTDTAHVYFILEQINHPSVLGFDELSRILGFAENAGVKFVFQHVVNPEAARIAIGNLALALADKLNLTLDLKFFATYEEAESQLMLKIEAPV